MALDAKAQAALALHRFGVGPRAGSIAAIASDPRGALLAELDRAGAGRIVNPDLSTSGAAARTAFTFQQAQRTARRAERATREANAQSAGAGGSPQRMPQEMPKEMTKPADQPGTPPAASP